MGGCVAHLELLVDLVDHGEHCRVVGDIPGQHGGILSTFTKVELVTVGWYRYGTKLLYLVPLNSTYGFYFGTVPLP